MSQDADTRILVVVDPNDDSVRTVEHALRGARDVRAESDDQVEVDVLIVGHAEGDGNDAAATRSRLKSTVADFEGAGISTDVDRLSPDDGGRAATLLDHVDDWAGDRLVVAADTALPVERLREVSGVARLELAPVEIPQERRRLVGPSSARRVATIFGLTYVFYLAVGGFVGGLDLVTGAISAAVVALSLARVSFSQEPAVGRAVPRLGRFLVFLPVLCWEIAKANVAIAYVILHPRLPIDPSMGVVETDTSEGLERMVLANSITLTPGTLVVDVDERAFTVHTLTGGATGDLIGDRLERLVAWVFHGRRGETTHGGSDR